MPYNMRLKIFLIEITDLHISTVINKLHIKKNWQMSITIDQNNQTNWHIFFFVFHMFIVEFFSLCQHIVMIPYFHVNIHVNLIDGLWYYILKHSFYTLDGYYSHCSGFSIQSHHTQLVNKGKFIGKKREILF